jgi:hypothetical protein
MHVVVAMSRYLIKERHPNYLSNEVDLIENLVLPNDSSRQGSLIIPNGTNEDFFIKPTSGQKRAGRLIDYRF